MGAPAHPRACARAARGRLRMSVDRARTIAPERFAGAVTQSSPRDPWPDIRSELRARGLRWTPQRKLILDVLAEAQGHVTGSVIVERCRAREPETTPSTVYRTLAVLEDLGYLHHSHGADGREEFHVLPAAEHAHLQCISCGGASESKPEGDRPPAATLARKRGVRAAVGRPAGPAGRAQP